MEFPRTEPKVALLADEMIQGLQQAGTVFITPPVPAVSPQPGFNSLQTRLTNWQTLKGQRATLKSQLDDLDEDIADEYLALQADMKQDLRYAENLPNVTQGQLQSIGWDTPAPPAPQGAPGQPRNFEIIGVAGKSYHFDWKKALDGGKVSLYVLKRRAVGTTEWTNVQNIPSDTTETTFTLESGNWELCVAAFNNKGEGLESNVVQTTV